MKKIRVSAVSYTNSKPFAYGIQNSEIINKIELSFDIPADCAQKLIDDRADIGLVPVAALLQIPGYQLVSDYCIGADGPVNSVFIFSKKPIKEIKSLRLDPQSRTSNALSKVLLKYYWIVKPEMVDFEDADAFVEIGDRTFGKKDKFPFVYDLAEEWKCFTGLPFVFAVWAANKQIPASFVDELNAALKMGVDNIPEVISQLPVREDFDLDDYLTNNLDFPLTDDKLKGLNLFFSYLEKGV